MDVISWVLVNGSYLIGVLLVLALLLAVGFGAAALGSRLLGHAREDDDSVVGSVILNLVSALVFGVLLAVATSDASESTTAATGAFLSELWNGFGSPSVGRAAVVVWTLASSIGAGLLQWATILPEFARAMVSDLGERGNFAIFLLPSLLCLAGLIIYDFRKPSSRGVIAAPAHILVFLNFVALAAFSTWLVMSTWAGLLLLLLFGGLLGGNNSPRYVVFRV